MQIKLSFIMSHSNQRMMAIAIRKSLLKETVHSNYQYGEKSNCQWASFETQRVVYMDDGDEFQIQLFNPETFTVGCLIYVNGKLMSQRKVVLRPGERIWLDRHIDTPDKLKFSTYEVGKSKAVQEAIKDNGLIKVDFYKESEDTPISLESPSVIWKNPCIYHYNDYNIMPLVAGDITWQADCVDQTNFACSSATSESAVLKASCATYTANTAINTHSNKMETGRVEKGGHSQQSFRNVDADFELFPYKTEKVKILPKSQKPVHSSDLRKRFCHQCGKKVKEGFKFCPFCGTEL